MKIKDLPLSKERWYKTMKKLLVCLIIIVTILKIGQSAAFTIFII